MASQECIAAAFMTLGCSPSSSEKDVTTAYLELVSIWHPDRFEADSALKSQGRQKLQLLNEAYKHLAQVFDDRRNQMELESQETKLAPKTSASVPIQGVNDAAAQFAIGYESISITVARRNTFDHDSSNEEVTFRKSVSIVTQYDGRWLTHETKTFVTAPLLPNESYESASSRSMAFRLTPIPNIGIGEYARGVILESGLTAFQNDRDPHYVGEESETLGWSGFRYVDGSELDEGVVRTDTWFHDEDKKIKHLKDSNELIDLRNVYRIFNKRGDGTACVLVAQRIVDLFPQKPENWLMLASCQHRWKTAAAALDSLTPAAELFPKEIAIHIDLARYSAMSGKPLAARQWLATVFSIAESWGPNSGFNRIRNQIANEPDLIALRDAIPNEPRSWKFKRFFGL